MVSSALALARQNPTPFVSAVRIVEREEALDRALLEERAGARGCSSSRALPQGRPRCWRARFFQVRTASHTVTHVPPSPDVPHPSPSGTTGGRVCAVPQRLLPAHAWARPGGTPVRPAARHHGRPGHRTSPAGALCAAALPADQSLPEGHPPLFTHPSGSGQRNLCCTLIRIIKVLQSSI